MKVILKAAAANIGTISTWVDGTKHKKVSPHKWVLIPKSTKPSKAIDVKARKYYDDATEISWAGLGIVEHLEDKYNIKSMKDLKKKLKGKPRSLASKIFRSTKDYVDSLSIPTGYKSAAIDRLGLAIIQLRNAYSVKDVVKTTLTVARISRTGKKRWAYKEVQPSFKPTKLKAAKARLGGWTDMSKMPTNAQLNKMLANGTAKVTSGSPESGKKWSVYQGLNDIIIPFQEKAKGITVGMRQIREGKERTRASAVVTVTVPYEYAMQFLRKQIKGRRTQVNLVGQLTRSAGFKKAIGNV